MLPLLPLAASLPVPQSLASLVAMEEAPSAVIVTLLAALLRLISCGAGARAFVGFPDAAAILLAALRHDDEGVCFAGLELLRRLTHNPRRPAELDDDVEATAKRVLLTVDMRVAIIQALDVRGG